MTRWNPLPAELYALVEQTPATVLLESAAPADFSAAAPVTRLFSAPLRVLTASQPAELPTLFAEIQRSVDTGLFAAGYFTYECGGFFEPKAARPARESQPAEQPLAWFGIYSKPRIFDHETGMFLDGGPRLPAQCDSPDRNSGVQKSITPSLSQSISTPNESNKSWTSSARETCITNLTIPRECACGGQRGFAYRRLHGAQPAPLQRVSAYAAPILFSLSPELFFAWMRSMPDCQPDSGWKPNAPHHHAPHEGHRCPRAYTAEDRAQAQWLANDAKTAPKT